MKQTFRRIAFVAGALVVVAVPAAYAFADLIGLPPVVTSVQSPSSVVAFICTILNWIFVAVIVMSIILVLSAAFKYMTGGGDPEKIKAAHKQLIYVAVGIAVAILARTIPVLVGNVITGKGASLNPCGGTAAATTP